MTDASRKVPVYGISIELTSYCNQQCRYCYNAWRDAVGQSQSATDSRALLARVQRLITTFEIGHFTITGGEPFASPHLFDLLQHLSGHTKPFQIISNGALVDDALARRLATYRPRYVQITLTGPAAPLHDLHTRAGQFDKTILGVKTLQQHGILVGGCVVITHQNASQVGAILEVWRTLGVRQIALSRFSPAGYAARFVGELLPTRDDMHLALQQAVPFARSGRMQLFSTMPVPPCVVEVERFKGIRFGSCAIGTSKQEFALGTGGELRNCTLHQHSIGGVKDIAASEVDLAALVRSADVARYRDQVPEFCEGCIHAKTCAGGCGAAAEWLRRGDGRTPDPFLWQHIDDDFAGRLARLREESRESHDQHVSPQDSSASS